MNGKGLQAVGILIAAIAAVLAVLNVHDVSKLSLYVVASLAGFTLYGAANKRDG